MTDTVAILGQSNASYLWEYGGITTFQSAINSLTGKTVSVIQGAVGGSRLLNPGSGHAYWLDRYDTDSPLYAFLANDLSNLRAIWWVQGEGEAATATTMEQYLAGLLQLQAIIAEVCGKQTKEIPFVISPLGNAARLYANGYAIRNAHFTAALKYPGFVLGPEYIDLAVQVDNIHLTDAIRPTFATRGATALAPFVGYAPVSGVGTGSLTAHKDSFTIDLSTTGTQVVPWPWQATSLEMNGRISGGSLAYAFSEGYCDSALNQGCTYYDGTSPIYKQSTSCIGEFSDGVANVLAIAVTAMGATSFTITKTHIAGSPTGTATINVLGLK